ncbi:sodium channel protein type 1 subunit alpha-like [Brachyhypopomus gauderio]|uniref:sodium channel protein type 1 subunit alpha-like n=1 Tax=Brachyhypopomus gauderio TaxID=698409 RepID=UPI00404232A9
MATALLPVAPDALQRLTHESLAAIQRRVPEERPEKPMDSTHGAGKVGQIQPQPDLEAGRVLPRIYGDVPARLVGVPLEDIDPFYFNNHRTFIVLNKRKAIFRFSASHALHLFSPLHLVRRLALRILVHSYPFTASALRMFM